VILQLEDALGAKDQVLLTGVDGTERFYSISTSLFDQVDLTRITALVLLLEEDRLTSPTSTLEVRLGDHPFIPTLVPDPSKTETDISQLTPIRHLLGFDSNASDGNPEGSVSLSQGSRTRFDLVYDLTTEDAFGGSITSFDNFGTTGVKETLDLTGETLILGLRDPGSPQVILQLEDATGRKDQVLLTGMDATERFYSGCARPGEFLRPTDLPAIPPSFDEDVQ